MRHLPYELLLQIAENVNRKDLLSLILCSNFHEPAIAVLYSHVTIDISGQLPFPRLSSSTPPFYTADLGPFSHPDKCTTHTNKYKIQKRNRYLRHIRQLTVRGNAALDDGLASPPPQSRVTGKRSRRQTFRGAHGLRECFEGVCEALAPNGLRELHIESQFHPTSDLQQIVDGIGRDQGQLQSLSLSVNGKFGPGQLLPTLQWTDGRSLKELRLRGITSLQDILEISQLVDDGWSALTFESLVVEPRTLTSSSVEWTRGRQAGILHADKTMLDQMLGMDRAALASLFPALRHVEVDGVTSTDMARMSQQLNFSHLTHMRVSRCDSVFDTLLALAAGGCAPRIAELTIHADQKSEGGPVQIADKVAQLSSSMVGLRRLSVQGPTNPGEQKAW